MAKATTYTASYNGKIIGQRKSPRPYLFAVIALHDEAGDRKYAYEYVADKQDRKTFEFYLKGSQYKAGDCVRYVNDHSDGRVWFGQPLKQEEIDRDAEMVIGGFDAYIARRKAELVAHFEARKAKGHYEPHVAGWSMSRRNAEKMAAACSSKVLAIVDAVAK